MIQTVIEWLVDAITVFGYPGVFISVFVESFFAPIPSEIILPFSGFVASKGSMNIYIVIFVATVAAYLGSLPFYIAGSWGENPLLKLINRYGKYLFIEKHDVDRVFKLFEKYGNGIVLVGRLIPIVRTLISFPAGAAKMELIKFSVYTLLGSMIWNILLTYSGYLLGDNWEGVSGWISDYEHIIIGVIVIFIFLYVGRGVYNRLYRRE